MDLDGFEGPTFNIPDFFRRQIALYLRTVRGAWGAFRDRHGDPQKVAQSNRPEAWAPYALVKLRRLEKILLWALALAASFVEGLAAPKERPVRAREPRVVKPELRTDPSTWRVTFARLPHTGARYVSDTPRKPPPRERDVMRTLARKLETLRRVVVAPEKAAMVIARRMRRRYLHTGWKPPKRPPREGRRDWCGDMEGVWELADREIRRMSRLMMDRHIAALDSS
jgi:hypothetical protein